MLRQQHGAKRRRDREGGDQTAGQGVGVGLRHRPEDVAFDSAQGEQRNEARDDDAGGEEDRAIDRKRRLKNRQQLAAQPGRRRCDRPNRSHGAYLPETTEHALDQDHGGIHDQPEVDGTDRQEVGRFTANDQNADGKEEGERDGGADDDGAAQVAQEQPLQQEYQGDSEHHVVQDRPRGDVDEILAVVDALDPDSRRQDAAVDALDFLLDAPDRGRALLAAAHQNDALDDVVVLVDAGDAQPRLMP